MFINKLIILSLCFVGVISANRTCGLEPVFRSNGDLRLSLIINECSSSSLRHTLYLTSWWVCERLNTLKIFGEFKLGVDIYNTCDKNEMIQPIVEAATHENYHLGNKIFSFQALSCIIQKICIPAYKISKIENIYIK